jgi:AcrR family transcriptional regulator
VSVDVDHVEAVEEHGPPFVATPASKPHSQIAVPSLDSIRRFTYAWGVPAQTSEDLAPDDSTPTRLLDATERLIGELGVNGASVRAINAAAASNVAAAHYHFGSKEALVAAALERRMGPLAADRLAMLDELAGMRRPPVDRIVEALVLPLARFCDTEDGRYYIRFLATLDRSGDPWRGLLTEAFSPQWERLDPILAAALPDLSDEMRRFRFSVAASTMLDVLANAERHLGGDQAVPLPAAVVPDLIDIITGALTAPPTHWRQP